MNLISIKLMDVVSGTSTNVDGLPFFIKVSNLIDDGHKIRLSLEDLTPMSSSFLHSSFGELLDKYGYKNLTEKIVLNNYKLSDAKKIKTYLQEVSSFQ